MFRFRRRLLVCFLQALPLLLFSQQPPIPEPCGSDHLYQALLKSHPEIAAARDRMDQALYQEQLAKAGKPNTGTNEPIVLPVVFHIIHNNGPENIPDERIHLALEYLNQSFSHTGAYAQNGPGADMGIQFCLAKRDPDGAPTSGITRTVSPLTNVLVDPDDENLKNLMRWDPFRYINIWVINSIYEHAPPAQAYGGYALLPFNVGSARDGIVIVAQSTGLMTSSGNGVLPHEMGHYLGLYHTFEGGCLNDNCLTQGDRVCDTPPDQGIFTACTFNSCHTDADAPAPNPFNTDVPDMTDNFLDYSPASCWNRFTEGQGERMRNLTQSNRFRLLDSPACLEPCIAGTTAAVDLSGLVTMPVADTLFIQNLSQNAQSYTWYVDGIVKAQTEVFNYVPDQVGFHRINLVATGDGPNCVSATDFRVNVICNLIGSIEASSEIGIPGEPMQFHAAIPHADQFEWSVNGVVAGTGPDLNTVFPQTGTHTVNVTASNAFCSLTLVQTVPVPPYCAPAAPPQLGYYFGNTSVKINTIEAYPNGDLLLGGVQGLNAMLTRLSKDGVPLWSKNMGFPSFSEQVLKVSILSDYTAVVYGSNDTCLFLAKIDANGTVLWIRNLTKYGNKPQMTVQENGNILTACIPSVTGVLYQYFDPQGQIIWERRDTNTTYLYSLCARNGGGSYVLSYVDHNNVAVIRMDENGQVLWAKKIKAADQTSSLIGSRVVPEPDGGVTGYFFGLSDFVYVLKWDNNGHLLWSNRYGTGSETPYRFFKKTPDNGYLFSASTSSIANGNGYDRQVFTKLDVDGNVKWAFSTLGFDSANGVNYDALCNDAVEWNGETSIPLKVRYGDFFYLLKTNQEGYAGNCAQTPVSIQKQSFGIVDDIITINFIQPPPDTSSIPPVGVLTPVAIQLIPYVECPQYPVCAENCNNGIDDDGDGLIDCYDPECNCYADQNCTAPRPVGINARVAWESAKDVNVLSVPIVANLNPETETVPEITLTGYAANETTPRRLLIFNGDGTNRNQPDNIGLSGMYANPASHVAVADVLKDGAPDVFVKTNTSLISSHYYRPKKSVPLPVQASLNPTENGHRTNSRPAFADFDNNGVPDVYAGNMVVGLYKNNISGVLGLNDISRADTTKPSGRLAFNNFIYNASSSVAAELLTKSQCNGDPDCDGPEIGAGPVMYSVDMSFWDGEPQGIAIKRDLNVLDAGNTIWSDGYTASADINLDNIPELIVAGKRDAVYGVYAWNRNGLVKWFPYPENTPLSGGMPCIANVFDDRTLGYSTDYPEIIAVSSNRLTCFNLNIANSNPNAPYWWSIPTTDSLGFTAATAFDFNADGFAELVYHDRTQLRIIYGGNSPYPANVDANRNWFSMDAPSVTADQYPVVADCDGDGEAEIIFTSFDTGGPDSIGSLRGRLRVLKVNAPATWTGTRPVWNQFAYSGVQVNDDLSIPVQQQSGIVTGGGRRPLNTFLGQLPAFNSNYEAIITAANASVTVDSTWCADQNILVRLKVCNTGLRNLPDSIPLRFYTSSPTLGNASKWGDLQYFQIKTAPGNCSQQIFRVPALNGVKLYAVLNDDGSIPRPYNLAAGFNPLRVLECNYTDNLIETSFNWNHPVLDLGPDLSSCSANAVTLDAGDNFAAYRWNDGSVEQQYTATGPGIYHVNVRDICGYTQSDTIVISMAPHGQLDLGPDHTICAGDTVQLTAGGFEAISWSPAGAVSCSTCPAVFSFPTETLLLTATGSNADCFASDSVRITVLDLPLAQLSATPASNGNNNGSVSAIPLAGVAPFSYQWSTQPVQTGDTAINLSPGAYTVTITDANACSSVQTIEVTASVAVQEAAENDIFLQVVPNPASGQFTVKAVFDQSGKGSISIVDVLGRTVLTADFQGEQLLKTVDCTDWAAGVYGVHVSFEGRDVGVRRVVVGR